MFPLKEYLQSIGRKGGQARARNMTAEQRRQAASEAAKAPRQRQARCECGAYSLRYAREKGHVCEKQGDSK